MKEKINISEWWKKIYRRNTFGLSLIVFLITTAIYLILQPAVFEEGVMARILTSNFRTWLPVILLAIGQTIVMLGGGLDLSAGAMVSLGNVILAIMITDETATGFNLMIVGLVILFGLIAGLINGFFTAVLDLQPMITTFASSFLYSGLALLILPNPGGKIPRVYTGFYRNTQILGIPLAIYIIVAILVIWIIIKGRKYGRNLFAVGGSPTAAYTTGIRVTWIKISTYVISGLLASLAAIAYSLLTGSGSATSGDGMTLTSITAAIIGGTAMSGGSGSIFGAVMGAIILGISKNIISLAKFDSWYRLLINAVVIVVALAGPGVINLFRRDKSS